LLKKTKDQEVKKVQELVLSLNDPNNYEEYKESWKVKGKDVMRSGEKLLNNNIVEEEERKLKMEKRKLEIQMLHEDAITAKVDAVIEKK
jgi:hypothetical protein